MIRFPAPPPSTPVPGRRSTHRATGGVPALRWPEQADVVEELRLRKVPRLLLVHPGEQPPTTLDPMEDWVRLPVDERELRVRCDTLRARAAQRRPAIDAQNVLSFAGRHLPLAASEAEIARLLIESYGSVVSRHVLAARVWPEDRDGRRNALDVRILRTRRRVAPLGLFIKTVRQRGYLLHADVDEGAV
ncbi:winged helix-turn-helix domain-containing protein [Streptomyces sp. NRRL S-920]|uniref:winged helix-turn-helix domain-containing protein n=1 Tax=Streptomyces sp. NRRL S-920 TaxID=1463921 RepID=UPI0009970DA2|nr:winged helix-turn-helix domain-containing protein [Streptomyces sp. NRRL S-920]